MYNAYDSRSERQAITDILILHLNCMFGSENSPKCESRAFHRKKPIGGIVYIGLTALYLYWNTLHEQRPSEAHLDDTINIICCISMDESRLT